MADRIGQQLGNYQLVRLLGLGGFAEVYLGEHVHLETQAAIKVLHTQLTGQDGKQFRSEARTIAHLMHPQIVRVLDFGVEGTTPFLVMDYAPNGTLRQRHPKGLPVAPRTVVSYVKQIAEALQYAHDEKLIHRDVKPENMLVGRRDEIILSDFGIVAIAHSTSSMTNQASAGTAPYMAPEQIQSQARAASDQYALGIVVYEWLTGERPFDGSFTEIFAKHLMTPPPSLRQKVPTISVELEQVVLTALAKDPKQRFSSVRDFATALEQASGAFAATAVPSKTQPLSSGLHVVAKQPSSRRKLLIGGSVLVAGGVGIGLVASQANPKAPQSQAISNVDKQVKDAFNQGANQAKRELLASLDTIENFSLQGAIDAARLTRTAYDVFVSPIVRFGSAITGDYLTGMLNALKSARGVLASVNQDNATLAAIQKILESWVAQVQNLPKQLNAITDTDLDGAQAYLHALQSKIENEKKTLSNSTPTT